MEKAQSRRLGAQPTPRGTRFAAWSTKANAMGVRLFDPSGNALETRPLHLMGDGLFEAVYPDVKPGALYKLVVHDQELPDPYARALPFGVHGPARVMARRAPARPFVASPFDEWVIYELHVGTFTPEGTFRAAAAKLAHLRDLGINAVELMPVHAFAGKRGWGYDGVALYAPFEGYGTPDDLAAFIDEAHALGIAAVLDVVYNHFGPAGNYLTAYSPGYFTARHKTPWGDAPDYSNPFMRELVLDNARYWLEEFGFDGLRLDAAHAIVDDSPTHLLRELSDIAVAMKHPRVLMAEDERNEPAVVRELGMRAVWADDFHHQVRVKLTGERDGYYAAYEPTAAALAQTIARGWTYEGQPYPTSGEPRGKPATLAKDELIYCVQNHDQIGNRALGTRLHHDAGVDAYAAVSMLLLFLPSVPLLFMGQEWAASTPFLYFSDHEPELGERVSKGRREEFKTFAAFTDPKVRETIPDPQAEETFLRSKLRWDEAKTAEHARVLSLYRTMIGLRRGDRVLSDPRATLSARANGEVLEVTRSAGGTTRKLVVNFGKSAATLPGDLAQGAHLLCASKAVERGTLPAQAAALFGIG